MTPTMKMLGAGLAAGLIATGSSLAGDSRGTKAPVQVTEEECSICDIFDLATLYDNSDNPVIQKFALSGRLQADAAFYDSDQGDFEELLWRRARFGFKATVLNDFTVHAEGDFDLNNHDPLYSSLTDANVAWNPSDAFGVKIGKQSAAFTLDGATSSKQLLRPERGILSENLWFTQEYFSGVSLGGNVDKWVYNIGGFSSSVNDEFGDFDGGYFGLASLGYDFNESLGLDKALVRVDYVYNDENENNNGTRDLAQVVSLNGKFEKDKFGVWTDVNYGDGYGKQSDLFGLSVMPFYNVTEKLQLVGSYSFVTSDGDNGVRLDRYENRIEKGRSDEAHEFFAGVNYYLCGHKLKWQTGVEYTTASDSAGDGGAYDGWGATSAVRISW
jgi:phosphate-selective porin OprO/OprP